LGQVEAAARLGYRLYRITLLFLTF
jgi:hypothetical protein